MRPNRAAETQHSPQPLEGQRGEKRTRDARDLSYIKPTTPAVRRLRLAIVFLVSVVVCGLLDYTGQCGFDWLEQDAYSTLMDWHIVRHPVRKEDQKIVLVTLSDETFEKLEGPPVRRNIHADVIKELKLAGAKVIAFDLVFDVPRKEDKAMADAVRLPGSQVLWAVLFDNYRKLVQPADLLMKASSNIGHIVVPHDADRPKVDRIQPFITQFQNDGSDSNDEGRLIPALGLSAAMIYLGMDPSQVPERVLGGWQVGDLFVPSDTGAGNTSGTFRISYLGAQDASFPRYRYEDLVYFPPSLSKVAPADSTGQSVPYDFKDKIVLIGDTTKVGNDILYTPVGSMWGVEAHAHAISTILRGSFVQPAPLVANFAAICILAASMCFFVRARRVLRVVVLALILFLAYLVVNGWLFDQGFALHVVGPCAALLMTTLGGLVERSMAGEHERERMFDTLVTAAASAIEVRDPSTSGHSRRVTALTMALARAVSETTEGRLKKVRFTPAQMRELRFATMLHDFGKIGVRENILTKSHKLEPLHFSVVTSRLLRLRDQRDRDYLQQKVAILLELPRAADEILEQIEAERLSVLEQIDEDLILLQRANDPALKSLPDDEYAALLDLLDYLSSITYRGEDGRTMPLLTDVEKEALRVRRGSLTEDEYHQIQHHATMSYDFLRQIPWTDELQAIPNIAYCHHEKLNGKGYPRGIAEEEIPLQARIMTIADIYDALTASDRAYKKALLPEQALHILRTEALDGGVDQELLDIFINREVYLVTESALGSTNLATPATPTAETRLESTYAGSA